jgi:hypothetical protein
MNSLMAVRIQFFWLFQCTSRAKCENTPRGGVNARFGGQRTKTGPFSPMAVSQTRHDFRRICRASLTAGRLSVRSA